ncbi:MAG: sulfite exporter TauE/SafE family protein [Myxococcota bacterium]
MSLEFWYLLPVAAAVGTAAMSAGISGSNFWIPIFVLGLRLDPRVSFLLALATMTFGFGAGVVRYARAGHIDRAQLRRLARFAVPAAALGSLVAGRVEVEPLLATFAAFAAVQGALLLATAPAPLDPGSKRLPALAALGGLSQGLIATGSGGVVGSSMLASRAEGEHATAVGTTVALVFAASLASAAMRLDAGMRQTIAQGAPTLWSMFVFLVPGALLGGQIGPRLAAKLPRRALRRWAGAVLVVVAALVGARALA